ncbi:MAG TPA: hypothetical protein VGC13_04470 [Longimicrobium sp.]|jgi:hypothetical protein|uniref:hypothetical protein n=1 Tax=Longimicrobium sp. TaxID=2029185 RepID=UPI002EDB38F6
MPENQNQIENVEIEPLSDQDLEGVAGGNEIGEELVGDSGGTTSSGPSCCSCSSCSR